MEYMDNFRDPAKLRMSSKVVGIEVLKPHHEEVIQNLG
jgi:hypothetical protein